MGGEGEWCYFCSAGLSRSINIFIDSAAHLQGISGTRMHIVAKFRDISSCNPVSLRSVLPAVCQGQTPLGVICTLAENTCQRGIRVFILSA